MNLSERRRRGGGNGQSLGFRSDYGDLRYMRWWLWFGHNVWLELVVVVIWWGVVGDSWLESDVVVNRSE